MVKLTDERLVKEIIRELSLDEKVKFLAAVTACYSNAIAERDIPALILADGATGVNATHIILDFMAELMAAAQNGLGETDEQQGDQAQYGNLFGDLTGLIAMEEEKAREKAQENFLTTAFMDYLKGRRNKEGKFVSFPSGINIGACFDESIAYRAGEAVGKELRAANVSVCLGPNVDIIRDPLGGRNYEMYGEDPVLVGRTAAAFIRGMQSTGTMACAKHFIANNQETNRQIKNTHVSIRTLRELYARGFRAAVRDGKVKSVMSAYNAVNGTFSSYNKMLLTDWLKEEWGFDGFVVSDWGAVTGNNDQAVAAGMDMILSGFAAGDLSDISDAVLQGSLDEARIDDAVERILRATLWQIKEKEANESIYNQKEILDCAYKTITDSIVLLKNDDVLPFGNEVKAALYGTKAKETMECGSGSTFVTTSLHSNLYSELQKAGVIVESEAMDGSEVVIYAAGAEGGENVDRPSMELDKKDEKEIAGILKEAKQKGKKTVVVLNIAGPVDMRNWIAYADAVVCEFVPGCMGGKAVADVLMGAAVPGGRLPVTFPLKLTDSPAAPFAVGEYDNIYYSEGIFNGYRWYDSKELPVQFPFGYGLSYTTFECREEKVPERWNLLTEDTLEVQVWVKNSGSRYGAEVVQLYLGQREARIPMPEKELMAYGKIWLEPGEEKKITLTVKREDIAVYDPQKKREVLPIGKYVLMLGTNARNLFYQCKLDVQGENPYKMDENTLAGEIFENPEAVGIVAKYFPDIVQFPEEHKKLMANEKIGSLIEKYMIGIIPNANELKGLLDNMFAELGDIL